MVKCIYKFTIVVLMVSLCVLGVFVPVVAARDTFAPSWLKEGTYVKYEVYDMNHDGKLGDFSFFDVSNPYQAGTNYLRGNQKADFLLETKTCSAMWQCVNINNTMAELKVTLDYDGKLLWPSDYSGSTSFHREGIVFVDLYTRAVYDAEDVFLGTTHLWLPSNPVDGQVMTVWEEDSEIVTTQAKISDALVHTSLGDLAVFELNPKNVTLKHNIWWIGQSYDLETGLAVSTELYQWDPIFASVGIRDGTFFGFSETGIGMVSVSPKTDWTQILYYAIIPVAIILLVATLIIKRKKKKN